MSAPLAIELFAGSFGWSAGWLELGGWAVGFDLEHLPHHGPVPDGADLVIQDVLTLHGSQFKDAALIVCSPPCQAYSYRAMPWKRAKALPPPDNSLFDACFRIQREACAAAGRHIPMVVENVRGAQKWVGRSRWNFGSFHLWGDVPALMPMTVRGRMKAAVTHRPNDAPLLDFRKGIPHAPTGHWTNPDENGTKQGGDWFNAPGSISRTTAGNIGKSNARKAASAMIARIPLPLSRYIARTYFPMRCSERKPAHVRLMEVSNEIQRADARRHRSQPASQPSWSGELDRLRARVESLDTLLREARPYITDSELMGRVRAILAESEPNAAPPAPAPFVPCMSCDYPSKCTRLEECADTWMQYAPAPSEVSMIEHYNAEQQPPSPAKENGI